MDRIQRAAFNITAAFEGTGYSGFQTYDKGIVTYGWLGFTLQSGSLEKVIGEFVITRPDRFLTSPLDGYLSAIEDRAEWLRHDEEFTAMLSGLGTLKRMRVAQDTVAEEEYWTPSQNFSVKPRAIKTPLFKAFIFDMAASHGLGHELIANAEAKLMLPFKKPLPDLETEKLLYVQVARERVDLMRRLNDQSKGTRGGLVVRADFWLVCRDWELEGQDNAGGMGQLLVKPGRWAKVNKFTPAELA